MSFGPVPGTPATGSDIVADQASRFHWGGVCPDHIVIQLKSTALAPMVGKLNVTSWADIAEDFEFEILPSQRLPLPFAGSTKDGKALKISDLMLGSESNLIYRRDFTVTGYYPGS